MSKDKSTKSTKKKIKDVSWGRGRFGDYSQYIAWDDQNKLNDGWTEDEAENGKPVYFKGELVTHIDRYDGLYDELKVGEDSRDEHRLARGMTQESIDSIFKKSSMFENGRTDVRTKFKRGAIRDPEDPMSYLYGYSTADYRKLKTEVYGEGSGE